jgi:hypothetical protein
MVLVQRLSRSEAALPQKSALPNTFVPSRESLPECGTTLGE